MSRGPHARAGSQPGRSADGRSRNDRLLHRPLAIGFLAVSVALIGSEARAAERGEPVRIGVLTESWGPTTHVVGLRDGLVELGYRENEHFVIGVRFTQGDVAALPAAARELVQQRVDIIFTDSPSAAQAATSRLPIVFSGGVDPVRLGLVHSFARPGGNITGVTGLTLELAPKRLEVFREVITSLKRVLLPYDVTDSYAVAEASVYRDAARRLGIMLVEKPLQTQEEAQATLAQIRKGDVDGIVKPGGISLNIPGFILEAAAHRGIPTMFTNTWYVERGGLASYGPDNYASGKQAARLVDKILKGANPAEIPVEVNTKIEFAINLKTARALGLTIAPEVLFRADRIFR